MRKSPSAIFYPTVNWNRPFLTLPRWVNSCKAALPLVALPRVQAFGIVSKDERSIGGMLMGVDFAAEAAQLDLFENISAGAVPTQPDEALVGAAMARNLGAELGDDIVILGSGKQGGVAAMALTIGGILSTGQAELDRSLLFAPLAGVQEAFGLEDEVHNIVLVLENYAQGAALAQPISELLQADQSYRTWQQLLPEVEQGIELDRVSGQLFFFYSADIGQFCGFEYLRDGDFRAHQGVRDAYGVGPAALADHWPGANRGILFRHPRCICIGSVLECGPGGVFVPGRYSIGRHRWRGGSTIFGADAGG